MIFKLEEIELLGKQLDDTKSEAADAIKLKDDLVSKLTNSISDIKQEIMDRCNAATRRVNIELNFLIIVSSIYVLSQSFELIVKQWNLLEPGFAISEVVFLVISSLGIKIPKVQILVDKLCDKYNNYLYHRSIRRNNALTRLESDLSDIMK